MVTCSRVVDGGRWKGELVAGEQVMRSSRALVYDVETGTLRYSKSRAALNSRPKFPEPSSLVGDAQLGVDVAAVQYKLLTKHHCGGGSGESSPTCVIQNSALRSNSSSPTMSTISKASSDLGRKSHDLEGRSYSGSAVNFARVVSSPESAAGASPGSESHKVGDVRGRKKLGNSTPGRPGLKGAPLRRVEDDSSGAKENGWAIPQDAARGEVKDIQSGTPFKSIQCAVLADKTSDAAKHKKSHGGTPSSRPFLQSASIMHKSPGIFSFNATYMSRADSDHTEPDHHLHSDTARETVDLSRRTSTFLTPLLKPTPSKWDDAEKWLPGSETLNPARAKSRSGPLLAQMVATQAGMSIPWKGHLLGHQTRDSQEVASEPVVKTITASNASPKLATDVIDFTADEKEQLNLLFDRYSVERREVHSDGSSSPSAMNGSFMKLGARLEKPVVKSSPKTRDMGTTMTPIPSVEPSRTGTPLRATTREKSEGASRMAVNGDSDADGGTKSHTQAAESPRALTEKELQEKTRQEIVALGTQLGKANIAAAWAAKEAKDSAINGNRNKPSAIDLENIRRDVFASTADAWKEAEKAKYTSRFKEEEAKILAWEEHEKAKAEAEMRRVEAKAERMKVQAREKLANKVAATRRQAEELRLAAETRRTEAAARAARKAELLKTHGKISNLLFLSFLCT